MAAGLGKVQSQGMSTPLQNIIRQYGSAAIGGGHGWPTPPPMRGGAMDPYGYNRQAYGMTGLQGGYMRPPVFRGPQMDISNPPQQAVNPAVTVPVGRGNPFGVSTRETPSYW